MTNRLATSSECMSLSGRQARAAGCISTARRIADATGECGVRKDCEIVLMCKQEARRSPRQGDMSSCSEDSPRKAMRPFPGFRIACAEVTLPMVVTLRVTLGRGA